MASRIITQHYSKNIDLYHYAYIDLRGVGSRLNLFRKYLYQLIGEDREESLYDSELFGSHVSPEGLAEYNNIRNFALQDGWENDGEVYSPVANNYLPRYRKAKAKESGNSDVVRLMNSLAELYNAGLLTDSEFERKKQELLGRL